MTIALKKVPIVKWVPMTTTVKLDNFLYNV